MSSRCPPHKNNRSKCLLFTFFFSLSLRSCLHHLPLFRSPFLFSRTHSTFWVLPIPFLLASVHCSFLYDRFTFWASLLRVFILFFARTMKEAFRFLFSCVLSKCESSFLFFFSISLIICAISVLSYRSLLFLLPFASVQPPFYKENSSNEAVIPSSGGVCPLPLRCVR